MDRRDLGALGERLASELLERNGCRVLRRNVVVAVGELDLIALDAGVRVAVEVRSRWLEDPLISFDDTKLDRVWRSARTIQPPCGRLDLVTVRFHPAGADLRWLPNM
jgi:putative endonuclease